MKHKTKPVDKSDIRERVEEKFRARGSLRFHLLLVFGALLVLLFNAFNYWVLWGAPQGFTVASSHYHNSVTALCLLSASAALHVIHYYFRHGRGRERHEAETDLRIRHQLRHAAADEAEDLEELIRLRMETKLKNSRLVFWHLALFLGAMSLLVFVHLQNVRGRFIVDLEFWRGPLTFASIWGIGLAAHLLRYVFAYGFSAERRAAKIEAQVARELRRIEEGREGGVSRIEDERADAALIDELDEAGSRSILGAEEG